MILRKLAIPLALFAGVISCVPKEAEKIKEEDPPYFDIKAYFGKEADRLRLAQPLVTKVVAKDGDEELKTLRIQDWQRELDFFIASDINKVDWYDLYEIEKTDSSLTYTALDSALRTRRIQILTDGSDAEIRRITILNRDKNPLYRSEEALEYLPDTAYSILKEQHVRVLGESHYSISGTFK